MTCQMTIENSSLLLLSMTDIPVKDLVPHAVEVYTRIFGGQPEIVTSAPGRLNFGGEHCDYMGGYVLPFATVLRGVAAGRKVEGKVITLVEDNL